MKNSLKTLATSAMTAIVLSATVFSSIAAETIMCSSTQTEMNRNHAAHDSFITIKKQIYTDEKVVPVAMVSANEKKKKIVVQGNAKVFLVQSNKEWVSVEESDMNKISVKQMGNTLTVSSTEKTP